MSKTIEIKKVHIRNLVISFVSGFIILYCLEHFGQFSYKADYPIRNSYEKPTFSSEVSLGTKVSHIYFYSYFDTRIETGGNGFTLYDMDYTDTDFKKYSTKSYYYTQATLKDFKYGIFISLGLFLITLFFTNFKIKLS